MFHMFKEALSSVGATPGLVSLIVFVATFAGIVAWVWRKSGREHYEHMSQLPLDGRDSE